MAGMMKIVELGVSEPFSAVLTGGKDRPFTQSTVSEKIFPLAHLCNGLIATVKTGHKAKRLASLSREKKNRLWKLEAPGAECKRLSEWLETGIDT